MTTTLTGRLIRTKRLGVFLTLFLVVFSAGAAPRATTPEEVRSAAIVRESKPRLILAICRKPVDPEMARPLLQTLLDRPEFTGVPAAVAAPVSRPAPGDELLSSRFGLRGCRVEPFPPASKRD